MLGEFGRIQNKVKVFCDNQSAIHLAKNPAYHSKTKHVYVKYHFVRQVIDEGGILLEKVHTQNNCAYIFMKHITLENFGSIQLLLALKKDNER